MYHGRFKGTHYEAGFKYGSMLRKHGVIINGSPTFEITQEMKKFAADCAILYEEYYPEVIQEIKGMADGQETSFEILSQILFPMYCFRPKNHCTCFAISDHENMIFGRNSDFLVSIEKLYMNCIYSLDGVYAFNGNTTAFIQMEDGMNEHGLAVGLTFIYPHIRKPGLNAGMLLRYLLEKCKNVEEAITALKKLPIASAQTLTIADKEGDIAVVECNSKKFTVVYPKENENFVVTANDFNSEELKEFRTPDYIDDWQSHDRYNTAKEALVANKKKYSLEFAMNLLAGKYGFMCQYDRKKNTDTVWSVVYDVKNRKIYRVEGNPSRKMFKEDVRMKNVLKS
jgi:predicted choloylglycine hydrolase